MHKEFFVVSIDDVMPRIIFQDPSETACQKHADKHWMEVADSDEMVVVTCANDPQVAAAQRIPSC